LLAKVVHRCLILSIKLEEGYTMLDNQDFEPVKTP